MLTPDRHPVDCVSPLANFREEGRSIMEAAFGNQDWLPQAYIIEESSSRPTVPSPPSPDVSILVPDPMDTIWDEEEVIDIRVSNDEVWTVNKAMLDQSFWKDQERKDLKTKMEAVKIREQKVESDLTDFWAEDQGTIQKREAIRAGKWKVNDEFANFWGENQQLWEETVNRITRSG